MSTHVSEKTKWPRRRRAMVWSVAIILLGVMVLPLTGYLYVAVDQAFAQQQQQAAPQPPSAADQQTNPRANYWRAVRQGWEGYTAASGPYTTNVLIQNGGQNWRQVRMGPVISISAWVLAVVVGMIAVFPLVRGQIRLHVRPTSGRTVERWSLGERVLHWYVAILFILLTITGLSLLYGRAVLIPWWGLEGFSAYASVAIAVHNYLGPFLVVGVLIEIIVWLRWALPEKTDGEWLLRGGGFFGGKTPSAGHINAGEKYLTFWLGLVVAGGATMVTGLIMDFPIFGQSRELMQLSTVIHAAAATLWIVLTLGHIYLGAWGVEGTLPAMTRGRVSVEWAKEHHDLWYEREARKTEAETAKAGREAPRTV
jgi:formate dehydrogenase subunit gamma